MSAIKDLSAKFQSYVGYLEKKSNSQLDSFTANAGTANYTTFARDFKEFSGIDVQGMAWCDTFIDTVFCYQFGVETAKKLLGGFSAWTPSSAEFFKQKGQWHTGVPKEGDIIFFKSSRINHTGYVYKVDSGTVYTIEGNTSNASGVVANGGGVARKSYRINYSRIAGYGRPDYSIVGETNIKAEPIKKKTEAVTVNITLNQLSKGSKGKQVKTLQRLLQAVGHSVGSYGIDGDFGSATLEAVKNFQEVNGLVVDGIVGVKTWEKLLK